MQVKSIAEFSKGSILQYFRPSLSYHLSFRSLFCLFLRGHFTQVLLYFNLFLASTLRDETAEMLIQQGLEEIAQAPTSEQIAFLLVERARLLDELEAEQIRSQSAVSDGRMSEELQRTIDREREELHEEMEQQRTLSRNEADQLKREHEEEINVVMEENTRLEEELNEMKNKVMVSDLKHYIYGPRREKTCLRGFRQSEI